MRISDISIKNPVFAWMLMLALMIFGGISFSRLGVSQLPDVDFPVLTISVALEGASPEVMETSVVDPIEDFLMQVEGIKNISSSCKIGQASITVELNLDRDINVAVQEVQAKLAQVQRRLPAGVEVPTISKTNPDDQPIMWLALTYEKDDRQFLMKYARDYLKDRFTTVPGVGDIFLGGYVDPQLRIWIKQDALKRYNITSNDIIDAIKTEHVELPGGTVDIGDKSYNIRTYGEAKSIDEFKNIVISKRAGQTIADPTQMVKLGQVANIEEGLDEITRISRFNGKQSLGIGIRKQRGANSVEVARAVKAQLVEVNKILPDGMKLNVNFDSTVFIESSISEMIKHIILAILLTSAVCWMFLGSFSATINVILAIPTSILGAFIGLYFLGYTLNTFTLLGLTLAIGIVVDDSIMVLENIFRYNKMGRGKIQSAIIGTREITFAALAATASVMAIFIPVVFIKGIIGKFFMQYGVAISLAVFLSLLESLTITPMRSSAFMSYSERKTKLGKSFEWLMDQAASFYAKTLSLSLKHKWKVIFVSLFLFFASMYTIKFLPKEMAPSQDQGLFIIRMAYPVGSALSFADSENKKVEDLLRSKKEIKSVYASVGGFGGGASDVNTAMMFITLVPKGDRDISQKDLMNQLRKEIGKVTKAKVIIFDLSMRGLSAGRGFPIELNVLGGDWNALQESSQKLMKFMEENPQLTDVDTNYLLGMLEIGLAPQRLISASHGVSISAIGTTVNTLIGGIKVGQYIKDGHRYDIRVMLEKSDNRINEIKNLTVGNARANLIPVSKLSVIENKSSLQAIYRQNRQRAITLTSNLTPGASQDVEMEKIVTKSKEILPDGYWVDAGGSSKAFAETFQSLIFALILGFIVAYMILAAQFNSFLDPLTVLMSMPFSVSGALIGLLITGQSINMYSMIGLLLLMGIVKKNSIMLVEFTNTVRERGESSVIKALETACPIRLRPILMTSLSTISGAVPSALALGSGAEVYKPMSIAIIFGVLISTLFTLYVVPSVYLAFEKFRLRDKNQISIKKAFSEVGTEALEE